MGQPEIQVIDQGKTLLVQWSSTHTGRFYVRWLRFHCQCERCKPAFAGMYPLDEDAFDNDILLTKSCIHDCELQCSIEREIMDGHVTKIPMEFLLANCNCNPCIDNEIKRRDIDEKTPADGLPIVDREDIFSDDGLFDCLGKIVSFGFCIVKNIPIERENFLEFVKSIAPITSTLYGEVWNVVNKVKPCNAAYTENKLEFHQDLPMYESLPGVQFLFAFRFNESVQGGESKLVDLMRCAEILRRDHPKEFETLRRVPTCFHTRDMDRKYPAFFEHWKTNIELDYFSKAVIF